MKWKKLLRVACLSSAAYFLPHQALAATPPEAAAQTTIQSIIPAIPQAGFWMVDLSGIRATNVNVAVETLEGAVLAQKTLDVSNNQSVTLYDTDFVLQNGQPLPVQHVRLRMTGDDRFVNHFTYTKTGTSPTASGSLAAREPRMGYVFPGMIHNQPVPVNRVLAQHR